MDAQFRRLEQIIPVQIHNHPLWPAGADAGMVAQSRRMMEAILSGAAANRFQALRQASATAAASANAPLARRLLALQVLEHRFHRVELGIIGSGSSRSAKLWRAARGSDFRDTARENALILNRLQSSHAVPLFDFQSTRRLRQTRGAV